MPLNVKGADSDKGGNHWALTEAFTLLRDISVVPFIIHDAHKAKMSRWLPP